MIAREGHFRAAENLLGELPVVAILGARQVGKTTLALQILEAAMDAERWILMAECYRS